MKKKLKLKIFQFLIFFFFHHIYRNDKKMRGGAGKAIQFGQK